MVGQIKKRHPKIAPGRADVEPGCSDVPPPLRAQWGVMGGPQKLLRSPQNFLGSSRLQLAAGSRQFAHFLDYNSRNTAGPRRAPLEPGLRFPSCPAATESPVGAGTVPPEPGLSPRCRPSRSPRASLNRKCPPGPRKYPQFPSPDPQVPLRIPKSVPPPPVPSLSKKPSMCPLRPPNVLQLSPRPLSAPPDLLVIPQAPPNCPPSVF